MFYRSAYIQYLISFWRFWNEEFDQWRMYCGHMWVISYPESDTCIIESMTELGKSGHESRLGNE